MFEFRDYVEVTVYESGLNQYINLNLNIKIFQEFELWIY